MEDVINNTARIKQINVELVKEALKSLGEGTKQNIVEKTGLSVATCGNILRELVKTREVLEVEFAEPNGGRPARLYGYNGEYGYLLCLYLTVKKNQDFLSYKVSNLIGDLKEEQCIAVKDVDIKIIEQMIADLLKHYPQILAAGIGIPGVVREGVIGVCDEEKLAGIPIVKILEEKLHIKIIAENDMNSTVYGFYKEGHYNGDKTVAVICFLKNNFPGAGIIVNGQIIRGNSNFAGEISFIDYGMPKPELLKKLNKKEDFVHLAAKTIISMIAIINPKAIALTGDLFKPEQLEDIRRECKAYIPEEHMPELLIRETMEIDYMNGLTAIAMEHISDSVRLIKK